MKKHLQLLISGRVQGVCFRAEAQKKARELNITGSAKNQEDGSVLIEAEGEQENLDRFIDWCHIGPRMAKVTKVEVNEGSDQDLSGFEVDRGQQQKT